MITGTIANNTSITISTSDSCDESCATMVGLAASIAVAITLVAGVPLGVALGCCGLWCLMRRRRGGYGVSNGAGEKEKESREEVYEEPMPAAASETVFSLSDNQAYGKVTSQRQGGR